MRLNRTSSRLEKPTPVFLLRGLPARLLAGDNVEMLIHSVYFWLKPELTEAQRAAFVAGVESLRAIKSIDTVYIGKPAQMPPRPVVDSTYSYALNVAFKDIAAHDAYQVDPIHLAFVNNCKMFWSRVQIYDAM